MSTFNLNQSIRRATRLPENFCGSCSLREGATVMIISFQIIVVTMLVGACLVIFQFPTEMTGWWEKKMGEDLKLVFDPYNETIDSKEYGRVHNEVWIIIAWADVGICIGYLVLGCGVIISVINKSAHPVWYITWLVMTFSLMTVLVLGCIVLAVLLFTKKKKLSITSDVTPVVCFLTFSCIFLYGYMIVFSYLKKIYIARKLLLAAKKAKVVKAKKESQQPTVKMVKTVNKSPRGNNQTPNESSDDDQY